MIREIVKAEDDELVIKIPREYIGREIEYIVFPVEKKQVEKKERGSTVKSLRGVFHQYADRAKVTLEEGAWQNHIKTKFQPDD